MKKSIKMITCLIILAVMTISFSGCSEKEGGSSSSSALDKKVNLTVYVMGESPKKNILSKVYKELDKKTQKDLNATVRFKSSTWDDWQNKYNLALASGDNIDLMYSADWTNYPTKAASDAFLALDELLPKYAPNIWKNIKPEIWAGTKVKGKIYGVPVQYQEYVQHGASYREDLRKKYNLPEIKDIDTLEKYIETVMTKEGLKVPINEQDVMKEFFVATTKYQPIDSQDAYGMTKGLVVDPKNPTKSVIYYNLPEYKEMLKRMKSWQEKGFWSKSVLSSKEDAADWFNTGKSPIIFEQLPSKAKGTAEASAIAKDHPDWEVGYFNYNDMNGLIYSARANHNMMSIPQGAKNPERALMLLDKLQNDKEYFDLTTYGVPGFTYNLTSDGKLDYSKIDTKTITFDISPWAWRNSKLMRTSTTDWSKYSKIVDTLASKSKIDPLDGFSFDVTNVQTDIAAVTQVQEQYAKPFETGILTGSVDESYKTLIEKLKGAGIEKIKADVDKQLKAFQASKKK